MRKATPEEDERLDELLGEVQRQMHLLSERIGFLEAFASQVGIQTKGVEFTIRSPVIWQLYWDSYHQVIVDLASFTKSLISRGGLVGTLNNHLAQLRPGSARLPTVRSHFLGPGSQAVRAFHQKEFQKLSETSLLQAREKARLRLFPTLGTDGRVSQTHIMGLKERIKLTGQDIQRDRNWIAHRYARRAAAPSTSGIQGVRTALTLLQQIVGDLRLVSLGGSFASSGVPSPQAELSAQDLVDQLLEGGINEVVAAVGMNRDTGDQRFYWQFRRSYSWRDTPPDTPDGSLK